MCAGTYRNDMRKGMCAYILVLVHPTYKHMGVQVNYLMIYM